jgi:hypothetical protein
MEEIMINPAGQTSFVTFRNPLSEKPAIDASAYQALPPDAPKQETLSKMLIGLDHFLDFIPFGSTASNAINATQLAFIPKDEKESTLKAYHDHLKTKSYSGCLLYGIPVIGNIAKIGVTIFNQISPKKEIAEAKEEEKTPYGMSTIGRRMGSPY